jgi:hypothetical protein
VTNNSAPSYIRAGLGPEGTKRRTNLVAATYTTFQNAGGFVGPQLGSMVTLAYGVQGSLFATGAPRQTPAPSVLGLSNAGPYRDQAGGPAPRALHRLLCVPVHRLSDGWRPLALPARAGVMYGVWAVVLIGFAALCEGRRSKSARIYEGALLFVTCISCNYRDSPYKGDWRRTMTECPRRSRPGRGYEQVSAARGSSGGKGGGGAAGQKAGQEEDAGEKDSLYAAEGDRVTSESPTSGGC